LWVVGPPISSSLGTRPVVGEHDDDGVFHLAELVDEGEEASDLLVGVGEKRGEAFHEPLRQSALTLLEIVPCRDPGGPR
jgi:hypothetical protein